MKKTGVKAVDTTTFKTAFFCINCDGEVSHYTKMYSHGRCPLCGYKDPDAATIIKTTEKAYRMIRRPWWKFWDYKKEFLND